MIEVGKYATLTILHSDDTGVHLEDSAGDQVVLPRQEAPETIKQGDSLSVFIYHNFEGQKVATTKKPKITLFGFALLQVATMTKVGAFLDWGLDKGLLLPFSEQRRDLAEGRWYVVYLDMDDQGRLFATTKVEEQLQNIHLLVKEGDEVEIIILQKTDLGYTVIVNNEHKGLIYENEVFRPVRIGDRLTAYVKKIREENLLDISLQKTGFKQVIDENSQKILSVLNEHNGFLALTDKSSPDAIAGLLGMSKKAFKRAIGGLYKSRHIRIEEQGIRGLKK